MPSDASNRPDLEVLSVYRDYGVVPKSSRSDNFNKTPEDVSRYLHVRAGDLVVNKMKAWSGSVAVSSYEGIVSGDYLVCDVGPVVEPRFLHHLLRSKQLVGEMRIRSLGIRPNQERLYWDDLADIEVLLPDIEEQRRIANFLDDRVARIDRIIAARDEQRRLLTHSTVARLQELQDEWTEQFGRTRLGRVLSGLEQGWSPQAEATEAGPTEWGVMRAGCVNDGVFRERDNKRLPDGLEPRRHYELRSGDLLMSRASGSLDKIGNAAVVPEGVRSRLMLCDKVYRLTPAKGWDPRFIAPMLRTHKNRERIRLGVSGAEGMANNLPSGVVRSLSLPSVPPDRQESCIGVLQTMEREASEAASALATSTELLAEYKRSLVTAAVTGELDVSTTTSAIPG